MGKARVALLNLVRSGLALVVVRPMRVKLVWMESGCAKLVSNLDTLLGSAQLLRARVPLPHPSLLKVVMMGKGCRVESTL